MFHTVMLATVKKFLEEHRQEIALHKAAKEYFNQLGVQKLPTIKELNEQCAELLAEKKKISSNYYPFRTQMQEYVKNSLANTSSSNIRFLNHKLRPNV